MLVLTNSVLGWMVGWFAGWLCFGEFYDEEKAMASLRLSVLSFLSSSLVRQNILTVVPFKALANQANPLS